MKRKRAMGLLQKRRVDYHDANESSPTTAELSTNPVAFLITNWDRDKVVSGKGGFLLRFLKTSGIRKQ